MNEIEEKYFLPKAQNIKRIEEEIEGVRKKNVELRILFEELEKDMKELKKHRLSAKEEKMKENQILQERGGKIRTQIKKSKENAELKKKNTQKMELEIDGINEQVYIHTYIYIYILLLQALEEKNKLKELKDNSLNAKKQISTLNNDINL